jgi:hypothetical protein
MAQMIGEVPPLWASYWASNEYMKDQGVLLFFNFILFPSPLVFSPLIQKPFCFQRSQLQGQVLSGSNTLAGQALSRAVRVKSVIDLIRSMLVLDPAERHSVRQLEVIESHRWLEQLDSEPDNVV